LLAPALVTAAPATAGHAEDGLAATVATVPRLPFADERVELVVEVGNEREATLEEVTATFVLDGERVGTDEVHELGTYERAELSTLWDAELGTATLEVHLEADTADDEIQRTVDHEFWVSPRDRSDLVPPSLHLYPTPVVAGEPASLGLTVFNKGEGYSEASTSELRGALEDGSDRNLAQLDHGRLDPRSGGNVFSVHRVTLPAGLHELTFETDAQDTVDELDESNNERSRTLRVFERADPGVAGLDVEAEPVHAAGVDGPDNPWSEHEVTVTVANDGPGPTVAPTGVEARACQEAGPANQDKRRCETLDTWTLDRVDPGAERIVRTEWQPVGQLGDHEVCVELAYERGQVDGHDDARCQDADLLVGGTGLGGASLPVG